MNQNQSVGVVGNLAHFYTFVPALFKDYYFFHILQRELEELQESRHFQVIVFLKSCKRVYLMHKTLKKIGISSS